MELAVVLSGGVCRFRFCDDAPKYRIPLMFVFEKVHYTE